MTDVTVITPPDKLFNNSYKILLISPGVDVRKNLSKILETSTKNVNIYLYDEDGNNIDWLLENLNQCDICIFDIDNVNPIVQKFAGFIISNPRTFYLTNDHLTPYNLLSANRIYDLHWLENHIKEE